MVRRSEPWDSDPFAFEVDDAPNIFVSEQLEAADMRARQHRHREAAIDGHDVFRGILQTQIQLPADELFLKALARQSKIADIREPFGTQQFFGDVLRRAADAASLDKPQRSRLELFLRHRRWRSQ
jgi:hypothetical protein